MMKRMTPWVLGICLIGLLGTVSFAQDLPPANQPSFQGENTPRRPKPLFRGQGIALAGEEYHVVGVMVVKAPERVREKIGVEFIGHLRFDYQRYFLEVEEVSKDYLKATIMARSAPESGVPQREKLTPQDFQPVGSIELTVEEREGPPVAVGDMELEGVNYDTYIILRPPFRTPRGEGKNPPPRREGRNFPRPE